MLWLVYQKISNTHNTSSCFRNLSDASKEVYLNLSQARCFWSFLAGCRSELLPYSNKKHYFYHLIARYLYGWCSPNSLKFLFRRYLVAKAKSFATIFNESKSSFFFQQSGARYDHMTIWPYLVKEFNGFTKICFTTCLTNCLSQLLKLEIRN